VGYVLDKFGAGADEESRFDRSFNPEVTRHVSGGAMFRRRDTKR
jgi:hypothetical protein